MSLNIQGKIKRFFNLKFMGVQVVSLTLFIGVWIFLLYCNLDFGGLGVNDDVVIYRNLTQAYQIWQIPAHLYNNWSSRTIIEMTIVLFSMLPLQAWAVINSVIMVLILFMLAKLLDKKLEFESVLITCALFLSVQWQHMNTAGWIATTLNYLWTSAAGLFALYVLYKQMVGQKIPLYVQILSIISLIYSVNMELNVAFHLIVTLALIVYIICCKKQIPRLIYAHVAAIIVSLIYINLSPGVSFRFSNEIDGFFPDMLMRGFARNIELGISAAMRQFLFERYMLFALFCAAIAIAVFQMHKNIFYRFISLCPIVSTLCFGVFKNAFLSVLPIFTFIPQSVTQEGIITFANAYNFLSHIPFFVICGVITCIIVSLYIIFGHSETSVLAMLLFCAGFATAAAVGFTPVVWASGGRTSMIFMLCIIFLTVLIYKKIINKRSIAVVLFYIAVAVSAIEGAINLLQF